MISLRAAKRCVVVGRSRVSKRKRHDMKAWDVFISHASEDNDAVAVPLARLLHRAGARVWLDRHEISLGDRLREKLDERLEQRRYGVVLLRPHFLGKVWTNRELGALLSLEEGGEK